MRDRLGQQEDRFFAAVFPGSGLLFLAMLFASAAVVGGLTKLYAMTPKALIEVVSAFSTTGLLLGVTGQCEIQPLPVPRL